MQREKLTEVLHLRVTARVYDRVWRLAKERRCNDVSELMRDILDRALLDRVTATPTNGNGGALKVSEPAPVPVSIPAPVKDKPAPAPKQHRAA